MIECKKYMGTYRSIGEVRCNRPYYHQGVCRSTVDIIVGDQTLSWLYGDSTEIAAFARQLEADPDIDKKWTSGRFDYGKIGRREDILKAAIERLSAALIAHDIDDTEVQATELVGILASCWRTS